MAFLKQKADSPFDVQSMIDRMFDEFPAITEFQWPRAAQLPALDLYEKDGKYVLDVSVPGYEPKEINIEVDGATLTVSGAHTESEEKKGARYHRREMRTGSFRRSVTLPQDIDADKVEAAINKGVLSVTLSPMKPIATKKIPIKAQEGA